MKKILLILAVVFIANIHIASARKCLDGAVFDVDDNGRAVLVDCAKWERNPEAVLAEQVAINAYTNEEMEDFIVQNDKPDETPLLGKVQNKIDEVWHNFYQSVSN